MKGYIIIICQVQISMLLAGTFDLWTLLCTLFSGLCPCWHHKVHMETKLSF